mgnify:FL=1
MSGELRGQKEADTAPVTHLDDHAQHRSSVVRVYAKCSRCQDPESYSSIFVKILFKVQKAVASSRRSASPIVASTGSRLLSYGGACIYLLVITIPKTRDCATLRGTATADTIFTSLRYDIPSYARRTTLPLVIISNLPSLKHFNMGGDHFHSPLDSFISHWPAALLLRSLTLFCVSLEGPAWTENIAGISNSQTLVVLICDLAQRPGSQARGRAQGLVSSLQSLPLPRSFHTSWTRLRVSAGFRAHLHGYYIIWQSYFAIMEQSDREA